MATILQRIHGVEAAAAIANSMGDITEGMTYQAIDDKYGLLEELLPQERSARVRRRARGPDSHYKAHHRPPGMTEDGMERHRLVSTAIIEEGGRVTVEDVGRVWVRDIDPDKFGYLLGPQDQVIYQCLKAGLAPWEIGRHAAWPGFIGTAKMMLHVGSVNACHPEQAALDAHDVGRIKDVRGVPGNYALEAAAAVAAGAAEAYRPGATVQSVIETALAQLSERPRSKVEDGLDWTEEHGDWRELRPLYQEKYDGQPGSNAVEVLSSALAVLLLVEGDPREAIIASVNFGRDCDCRAYVAGGLSAAMHGIDALPTEWVQTIEDELPTDPYTVSRRSLRETAEGVHRALMNEVDGASGG
jgi:ADP-ribosylglycohydrolase